MTDDFATRRSFKSTLVTSVTFSLLAAVLLFGGMVRASMRQRLEVRWRDQAIALAKNLALGSELGVSAEVEDYLAGPVRGAMEITDVDYVIVTNEAGRVLCAGGDTVAAQAEGLSWLASARSDPSRILVHPLGRGRGSEAVAPVLSAALPADSEGAMLGEVSHGEDTIGWVRLGIGDASVRRELAILTRRLCIIAAFVLAVGFAGSWTLAERVAHRIRVLARAATAIGQGRWDHPIDVPGHDEIAYLAQRFRRMARDLRASEQEIREQNRTLEEKVAERTASLSRALDELRELDRMKDAFLSSVSHELRTPLTAIRSFSESMLLYEDEPPETRREFLTVIQRESERLSRLIEDVLDLSKIQSGKRQWNLEDFAIGEVISAIAESNAPLLLERRLRLEIPDGARGAFVHASRDGVHQVLQNLLGNAIKFSPEGTAIEVAVSSKDDQVSVSVADRGPGIPAAELEKIFDRFHQVGDTMTGKPKGTGLGLAICREIIRQHHGEIWAEQRPDGGAVITFVLPARRGESVPAGIQIEEPRAASASCAAVSIAASEAAASAAPGLAANSAPGAAPSSAPGAAPVILVADDEPSIRRHFELELTRRGYGVLLAENGVTTIQMARSMKPALVLLDIMMPDLMGFDVIRVLKNDPETSAIPIVVISVIEDRERGLTLGASDYLTKPVKPHALVGRIETLLSLRRPIVLLVSGDVEGSADIHAVLEQTRYKLECCGSGIEARQRLLAGDVDLVVLDGHDPTIDAPSFLRALRGDPSLAAMPVLVLTSQSMEGVEICGAGRTPERYLPRDSGSASITQALQEMLHDSEHIEEAA